MHQSYKKEYGSYNYKETKLEAEAEI